MVKYVCRTTYEEEKNFKNKGPNNFEIIEFVNMIKQYFIRKMEKSNRMHEQSNLTLKILRECMDMAEWLKE